MNAFVDQAQFLQSLWTDVAAKMMAGGVAVGPDANSPEGARRMRGILFEAMSQAIDKFMRSEPFLELMKQTLAASMESRQQLNRMMTRAQHEFQRPARQDVDNLQLSMQHVERRILDRVEELTAKVEELNRRLDGGKRKPAGKAKARRANRSQGA